MKAYWVVRGHILNPEEYGKYINLAGPVVKKYQGTFLSRGGRQEEKEGSGYERTVLIEFNSFEEALFCYNSDEYQEAMKIGNGEFNRHIQIIEGV